MPLCVLVFDEQLSTNLESLKVKYLKRSFIPFFIAQSVIKMQNAFSRHKCIKFNSNTSVKSIIWLDLKVIAVYLPHNVSRIILVWRLTIFTIVSPLERALTDFQKGCILWSLPQWRHEFFVVKAEKNSENNTAAISSQPGNLGKECHFTTLPLLVCLQQKRRTGQAGLKGSNSVFPSFLSLPCTHKSYSLPWQHLTLSNACCTRLLNTYFLKLFSFDVTKRILN